MPPGQGGDVLAVTTAVEYSGLCPFSFSQQSSYFVRGIVAVVVVVVVVMVRTLIHRHNRVRGHRIRLQ